MKHSLAGALSVALIIFVFHQSSSAQRTDRLRIRAMTVADVRAWETYLTARERSGELRLRSTERDPSLPARTVERLQQFYRGVPIWGAEVVRDSDQGVTQSIFGDLSNDLALATDPAFSLETATARFLVGQGDRAALLRAPQLTILPLDTGDPRLAYTAVVTNGRQVTRVFIDATTGAQLLQYSERHTQSAVGTGRGVLGDTKKMSVLREGGVFVADDQLRPPFLLTFDMHMSLNRLLDVLDGAALLPADRATDLDNDWTDPAAVDAHAQIGWTYDYYFTRHGRRGLDNRDRPMYSLINGVSPSGAVSLPDDLFDYAVNAFWCGDCGPNGIGVMFFGNGLPASFVYGGQTVAPLSGALDIAAHELTHGVTESSSNLIYLNESGALNEAFSDIMGTSVEFFYQTPGTARGQADYLIGEDVFRSAAPGVPNGFRSMANPGLFGDPDHYSQRFTGSEDDGGVHTNSAIPNQAFYLAIESGTNRTSGLAVQGVGAANREQIERVFYRAFVFLLPSSANFSTARAATIQAARDLYGTGSAAERAVTQAWTAVGVL